MSGLARDVVGSCPLDCPDACSWVISVDEIGRAAKIRGNPAHPVTRGGLCKKVNPWLEFAADSSRLTTPLRRSGAKGSGEFEPISWDEALDEMAHRLLGVRDEYGGEAIWPFYGTGHMGWIQGGSGEPGAQLFNRLGASKHAGTICSISGHVGMSYTTGTAAAMDPEDVVHAGVVLIWGSNTLVANQHFWPFVDEARANGATVVVIDPARTRTAERADRHLALLPGTDGALALGLCRAVLDRGGADPTFLAEQTLGWDAFEVALNDWSVERTAEICGVGVEDIEWLAALIASAPPLAVKLGQGMQRHANGGQAARVVSCLPAITGSYGKRGGGLVYSTSSAYGLNGYWMRRPDQRPHPVRSLAMTNLGRNLTGLGGDSLPVHALVMIGANPVVSNPQTDLVRTGLSRDDLFTVAVDLYPTESVAYADLVLPSAMQHEQIDITESFAHLYLHWNEPAVAPPGDCLAHTEMFRRLARSMERIDPSFADPDLQRSDVELAEALLRGTKYEDAGIGVDELRSAGYVRIPGTSPYEPFAEGFPTPSGAFEFASERAHADGHGILPEYRGPSELPDRDADAGLMLLARGSEWHINSVFAGTEKTQGRTRQPPIDLAAVDASDRGLVDGDLVDVSNGRGSFTAVVRVGGEARSGVAVTTKGWWRQGVNATVREEDSDMGRGAVFHDTRVEVSKAETMSEPSRRAR